MIIMIIGAGCRSEAGARDLPVPRVAREKNKNDDNNNNNNKNNNNNNHRMITIIMYLFCLGPFRVLRLHRRPSLLGAFLALAAACAALGDRS